LTVTRLGNPDVVGCPAGQGQEPCAGGVRRAVMATVGRVVSVV
jgi:hypothetical protein